MTPLMKIIVGTVLAGLALIGALIVLATDILGTPRRRAEQKSRAYIDAATLHGPDWADDGQACADCGQPIGVTRDGSHDRVHLSMCERITFEDLERRLEETR